MKRIEIEVTVEHFAEADDDTEMVKTPPDETASLSLTKFVPDEKPTAEAVDDLMKELSRRFKYVNARKTT